MGANDNFFSEMHQLPEGFKESFNEDEYINKLSSNKIEKGVLGNRDKFQERIFGQHNGIDKKEAELVIQIETLMSGHGYTQTQQGRTALLECVKKMKHLGIITG